MVNLQKQLKEKIQIKPLNNKPKTVAGADVSYSKRLDITFGVVLILEFPSMRIKKKYIQKERTKVSYIPGLLTFREAPTLLSLFKKVKEKVDLILIDGHGIAHPRGVGLASHIGLMLEKPTIGCAKNLLSGDFKKVGSFKGDYSFLKIGGKECGIVLRTRDNVKPMFISPGHKINISDSKWIIMECVKRYRIPEPIRLADIEASRLKRIFARK